MQLAGSHLSGSGDVFYLRAKPSCLPKFGDVSCIVTNDAFDQALVEWHLLTG